MLERVDPHVPLLPLICNTEVNCAQLLQLAQCEREGGQRSEMLAELEMSVIVNEPCNRSYRSGKGG